MPEFETPLENLFLYIRDLFGNPTTCTDFEKEKNNEKAKDINYWDIGSIFEIAKKVKRKNISDFEFVLTSELELFGNTLLKIKKIVIPTPPTPPTEIKDWIEINNYSNAFPAITHKKEMEQTEKFENSQKRNNAFTKYKRESENPLFPISVPEILNGWITSDNNQIEIVPERIVKVKFEDDATRVSKFKKFETEFNKYHQEFETPIEINRLYDGLHKLHYDIKGRDNIKLYFSFGLISGKIGNATYRNFTFHVPLKLTLKSHQLKIDFDTFSNKIFAEQNFAELLNEHFKSESPNAIESKKKDVLIAIDNFNAQQQQFVFEKDFIRASFYNNALEILNIFPTKENIFLKDDELNYELDKSSQTIRFSFSPIIQTKLTETKIDVANDANNIARKIFQLKQEGLIHLIPDFFKKLFATEINFESETDETESTSISDNERINSNGSELPQYLFPLPFNDEQFEIAKRLQEQDAVTVQGPPGTGKSHTIANLISHFVAQGKSILVVSHNSQALKVIKDKLPERIKNLSISLVNEGQGSVTLKESVKAIITNISQDYNESKIREINKEQANLEKKYADTLQKIYNLIQANSKQFKTINPFSNDIENRTSTGWAEYYFEKQFEENYSILDKVEHSTNTANFSKDILELIATGEKLNGSDFELYKFNFIEKDKFVTTTELRKIEDELNTIHSQINPHEFEKVNHESVDEKFLSELEKFNSHYSKLKETKTAFKLISNSSFQVSELAKIISENQNLIEQIEAAESVLLNYNLDITPISNENPFELHIQINQLILKFGENRTLNFLQKKLLNKQLSSFLECKVNYSDATNIDQLKIIETEITKRKTVEQLKITFSNYFQRNQLGTIENILESISHLKFVIVFDKTLKSFNENLGKVNNYALLNIHSPTFEEQLRFLNKLSLYARYKELQEELKQKVNLIKAHPKAHPLIHKIAEAILSVDRSSYERYWNEYFTEKGKSVPSKKYNELFKSLLSHLPDTTSFLDKALRRKEQINVSQLKLEQDLFLRQLHNFLETSLSKNNSSEKLFDDLQIIKKNIERNTEELIVAKTWFHKSKQVTDNELASLNAWLNDLTRIGAGYGKNVARDKAAAINNMQSAKRAVPIWIMQLESAITFFPDPTPNQFDVLIIDEASQCDISSLNLIFRARKTLIVGDENQTSVVVDRSMSIDRTNELLNKYFLHHQFKTQFDVTTRTSSVYAMSSVVYPNIVSLKEHFRCLPEIIGYSNQHIYSNSIIPLKTATELLYGEPTEIQYVEDEILDTKKPKIVEQVLERILQIIQDFKNGTLNKLPTIGVIALESSNLNHITELIRVVTNNEIVKQYEDDLDFKVGTSREFQGDERDIIFLTISATHKVEISGETVVMKPPVAAATEEFMRIYNVAASRARDKCILLHSIHPDAIALMNNPNCYRKKLLDYYLNPNAPQKTSNLLQDLLNRVDANSGEFEKGVCSFLYNNNFGNFITPQYKVGGYKIDFGIVKNNKKIAIECDGYLSHSSYDQVRNDIKRQEILERVGWQFFRIQSTEWFYKNENVSRKLLRWLNENLS